jgi:hypothetical protein
MDQSEGTPEKNGGNGAPEPIKNIKVDMANMYEDELEFFISRGQGMFLDNKQMQELHGTLDNVTTMVRLTTKSAWLEKNKSMFSHDVHVAMSHAMEKLDNIETIFIENSY